MGSFIDFIFGNFFLIFLIVSGIIGFLSGNKEEQKKQRQPSRRPRQPQTAPSRTERQMSPIPLEKEEPKEQSVMSMESESGAIGDEQQAQMERLQRKYGDGSVPKDVKSKLGDAVTENGLDVDFIKRQQLQKMGDVSKELSKEQKALKNDIRGSLRKKGLINGIIMAEVLGNPRAIKPYQSVTVERYKK
jgi:hypothetical protein